jgi:low affinity Fe/Cu permease
MASNGNGSSFTAFSRATSRLAGRPLTFVLVVLVVLGWALSGPLFGFSEAWQLTINTLTTIVTFLMVFLIQSTQNRDSEAIQLKLDEIILALDTARNELLDSENLSEEEQLRLHRKYLKMAEQARSRIKDHVSDIEERRERRERRTRS